VPKKYKKMLEAQQRRHQKMIQREKDKERSTEHSTNASTDLSDREKSETDFENNGEYSDSDKGGVSDDGFEGIDHHKLQQYEDDSNIDYRSYKFCVNRDGDTVASEGLIRETQLRKISFLINEIIIDLGI